MLETNKPIVNITKGWFGKSYSQAEVLTIVDIQKNKIKDEININEELKIIAEQNLIEYVTKISTELGVNTEFQEEEQKFDDNNLPNFVEINQNHPNLVREETKYLVIHTTNNLSPTATAEQHYNYWNNNPNANASANYVVDKDGVVQCVSIDKISWAVGVNAWLENQEITNQNSISIEMCNNLEFDKTLNNTIELIKNQILPVYPNIIIVRHKDATKKESCPDITEKEWKNFLSKIYF